MSESCSASMDALLMLSKLLTRITIIEIELQRIRSALDRSAAGSHPQSPTATSPNAGTASTIPDGPTPEAQPAPPRRAAKSKTPREYPPIVEGLYRRALVHFAACGHSVPCTDSTADAWKAALASILRGYVADGCRIPAASGEEIEAALEWIAGDPFWRRTTQSATGLKKHWPKIRPQFAESRPKTWSQLYSERERG